MLTIREGSTMNKFFVATIALLSGLLLGAVTVNVPKTFTGQINSTNPVAANVWSQIENWSCSQFDTAYGESAGTCAALMDPCIDRTTFSATCNSTTGKTVFTVTFDPPGSFDVTDP